MLMDTRRTRLDTDKYFHIYNRGIDSCQIFKKSRDFHLFIQLFKKHFENSITLLAYCLISNHFHFVVRVPSDPKKASQALSNLCNAYAKSFNKTYNRTGSLFEKPFRRIELDSELYLKRLILYVHLNPLKHKVFESFENYPYSSYQEVLFQYSDCIPHDEVISLFDDVKNFEWNHQFRKQQVLELLTLE